MLDVEPAGMTFKVIADLIDGLPSASLRPSPRGGMHASVIVVTDGEAVATQRLATVGGVLLAGGSWSVAIRWERRMATPS